MIKRLLTNRKRRQDFRSSVFWIVLLLLFAASGMSPAMADRYITIDKATLVDRVATDGFIELTLPAFKPGNGDTREGLNNSELKVMVDGEPNTLATCFHFYTKNPWLDEWQGANAIWHMGEQKTNWEIPTKDGHYFIRIDGRGSGECGPGPDQRKNGDAQFSGDGITWTAQGESTGYGDPDDYIYWLPETRGSDNTPICNLYVRWYVPEVLVEKNLVFVLDLGIEYDGDGEGAHNARRTFPVVIGGKYPAPNLSYNLSSTAGNYTVTYSGVSNPKEGSKIVWNDGKEENVNNITGNKDFSVLDKEQETKFTFKYLIHNHGTRAGNKPVYYSKEVTCNLPPFRQAQGINLKDLPGGDTEISWSTNNGNGVADFGAGDFEVQRSTDGGFVNNVKTVGKVQFLQGTNSYSLEDNTGEDNLNGEVYYRIRRDAAAQWGWEFATVKSTTKEMTHQSVASATAEMTDPTGTVELKWTLDELSANVATTTGAKICIVRKDLSAGGTPTSIIVPDADAKTYTDFLPVFCHRYQYEIYVKPGNNAYKEVPDVKTTVSNITSGNLENDPIIPSNLGEITGITVSKGYYPDFTRVEWTTNGKPIDEFIIERRIYGSNGGYLMAGSLTGDYTMFEDTKGSAGEIYEYRVIARGKCEGITTDKPSKTSIGFRSPTGVISGRITYDGTGYAKPDVVVKLNRDASVDIQPSRSLFFNGSDNSYIDTDDNVPLPSDFTVQMYVRPTEVKEATLFSAGNYRLGLTAAGKPRFSSDGGTSYLVLDTVLPTNGFSHLTATRQDGTLSLYVTDVNGEKTATGKGTFTSADSKVVVGKGYKGYIDEIRLWNRALTAAEIKRDYNRLLPGTDVSLIAYWRLDDPVTTEFYDLSNYNEKYNARHGKIHDATLRTGTEEIPTEPQLGLYGLTDKEGLYRITGVPYKGTGTTYTLTPSFPNHSFDPGSMTVVIGPNQTTATQDFKDRSSVHVTGYVYYENTTIPVQGAYFRQGENYIIGSDGKRVETKDDGSFDISVDAGTKVLVVEKANHVFKDGGRLLDSNGNNWNFDDPLTNIRFWDQTKVKVIGRVTGGPVESGKSLGFSLSKNNLGDNIQLKLTLQGNSTANLSVVKADSTMRHQVSLAGCTNQVSYEKDQILIYPNVKTGEYYAWLYPEKYKVEKVSVEGHGDLLKGAEELDLTNKLDLQTDEYKTTYTDASNVEHDTIYYLSYHDQYSCTYRAKPALTYKQLKRKGGEALDYFGDKTFTMMTQTGDNVEITLYDEGEYLFGCPVFHMATYYFKVFSHEDYFYNDVRTGDDVRVDQVPTEGGDLRITNNMQENSASEYVTLDETGTAEVAITVNSPDIGGNFLGKKTLEFVVGETEAPQLTAIVLGMRVRGNSYVTAGPVRLFNILRDPPGSNSYAYCEKGQTYTYYSSYATGKAHKGSETVNSYFGTEVETGFGIMVKNEAINTVGIKAEQEVSSSDANAEAFSITTTSRYQTSDDPLYVGADGDLFLGTTSNILYGPADDITILTKEEYNKLVAAKGGIGIYSEDNYKVLAEAGDYVVMKRLTLSIGVKHDTFFAYPQIFIKTTLMDNICALRNSLFAPYGTTESEAKSIANTTKAPVYVTHRKSDEDGYGEDNKTSRKDPSITPEDSAYISDGDSYTVYLPDGNFEGSTDSVYVLNQSIREWERVLEQNEREKLEATDLVNNYSFQAGALIEYAEEMSHAVESTHTYNLIAGGGMLGDLGLRAAGVGVIVSIEELGYGTKDEESTSSSEDSRSSGFVLAENGDDDYLSVDVYRVNAPMMEGDHFNDGWSSDLGSYIKTTQYGNFVFRTKGGATSCPYEGERLTEYYIPGSVLDKATLKIENPKISAEKSVVSNVPSDQAAVFKLNLYNESEAAEGCYFTLSVVDAANQHGAKFSMDGVPLGEGRGILVDYGEVLQKTLEIRRGTEYDYEDLAVVLKSQCQADPTDFQDIIADTVYISAHFIPSSSDINIKSPSDKWTLNTLSPVDSLGKYYMPLTIDGFDVNFQGFDHIEIQSKASSEADTKWVKICSFYNDSALYEVATGTKEMIDGATVTANFYGAEDQKYDIRAVTFSKVGNEFVTKSSPIISGVKDTKRPVVFGNIQPADGVLGIEDEIRLNFNEEIAEGYMTDVKNFQVTAIRNGSQGDHSTSLTFNGDSAYLATQAERNLTNKDLTVEMWVLPAALGQEMTLFSHGTSTNSLVLSIGADKSVKVRIGDKEYTSRPQDFKTTDWAHVAMSYKASNRQLSAYFGGIEVIAGVQTDSYTGSGPMLFGRDMKGGNFFAGKMHEARVWNKVVSPSSLVANKLTIYTGKELGMLAYYPMTEGKGDKVTDKAQGATAWIYGAEWSTLDGLSVAFKGDTILTVNSSRIPLTDEQDYTLEFWFKAFTGQKDAALVSNGKGLGEENNTSYNKVFVGFAGGKLVFRNNDHEEEVAGHWADGNWHHFAVSVNRNAGNAQIFMDGVLNTYFDAGKLGGFSATELNLGARRWTEAAQMVDHTDMYLKGQVDELQLWNMALPSTYIGNNYNVCPKGTEMGLMAYLPFSKYITNSANVKEMVFSGEDVVTDSTLVADGSKFVSTEKAPVRAKGPEVSIPFTFVVNKDALVINLMDTPEALEKTIVNFTVKEVSDLNGNLMQSPVTWSAYINRNQLKWSKASVTKEKKLYAQMSFTVDVENQGGTEKNFTIEGLPAWLSAEPMYGTIDPLGTQTINFTVDEGTNVGRYDEVVYVKGDNNVSEALPVTLKVFDEQPDWMVDPADFKYNMNIYGKLRVNRLFSTDAEDMIAAFDSDGRCVGVANNQYLKTNDMWYVFMTVYGNSMTGDKLEFRVWDASTGLVYDAYSSETISFKSDDVKGSAMSPIVFDAEERVIQNIGLKEGWNWISFNVASELLSNPEGLFKKLNFEGDELVKDETTATFSAYDPVAKDWVGDPVKLDNQHMFLLQSPVNQKLSVSGVAIHDKDSLTLDIAKGWNYISYLPTVNLPIVEALNGYEAKDGDIIKSQNAFSMYGSVTGWLGSLNYLEPGKGYMLSSAVAGKLVYPDMSAGGGLRSDIQTRSASMTEEPVYPDNRYEANMSVVATIAENLPVHTGDKLLAYSKGELRGATTLTENPENGTPLYFITVGGTGNETVSFALERNGEIIAQTSPVFDYRAHNVQGSIEQPVILDFMNDLQISVYPNPFERELNFVMNTAPGDKVEIYLYTLAGQMMYRHAETCVAGGYLHHRWVCNEELARTVYMAVVVVNGQKNVYKVRRK